MLKNLNDSSINIPQVEIILLLFQMWALYWYRYYIIIYIDSSTAYSGLLDFTFWGPENAIFREIFLLANEWDIVIESWLMEEKQNGLVDMLSRFDNRKIANIYSH